MDNSSSSPEFVLEARGVNKRFPIGGERVDALRNAEIAVRRGEIVSIIGPSGSGKSTLLGILGGLDSPNAGSVKIDGEEITGLSEDRLAEIRNRKIGFIFQMFNLIPTLTALENVAVPLQFHPHPPAPPRQRAEELLARLGLGDRMRHLPAQLSGGQQQRVAIARALANNPPLLLADEPTGNLNSEAGAMVLETLSRVRSEFGTAIVLVTHDRSVARAADRCYAMVDGVLKPAGPDGA